MLHRSKRIDPALVPGLGIFPNRARIANRQAILKGTNSARSYRFIGGGIDVREPFLVEGIL